MHTTRIEYREGLGGRTYTVLHNDDYSGDVHIMVPDEHVGEVVLDASRMQVTIPFEVLQELVGRAMMFKHISMVEDLDGRGFLSHLRR